MATRESRRTRKIPQLLDAVMEGDRALKHTREKDAEVKAMYAGDHYADYSDATGMHMNVMHRSMSAMLANLAGDDPECEVSPIDNPEFEGVAELSSRKITRDFKRVNARGTAELVLLDALCSFGTVKCGICPTDYGDGVSDDPGRWYMDRISVQDVILDASARAWDERLFHGHRYRMTRAAARASGLFDEETVNRLPRSKDEKDEEWGAASRKVDRARAFDLVDYIDLIDCWVAPGVLGAEAMFVTLPGGKDIEAAEVLRMEPYIGPRGGPYVQMGFHEVPGKLVPTAPAQFWRKLAAMTNMLLGKVMDSDLRYKKGSTADPSATDDQLQAFQKGDNEFFMRGNPALFGKLEIGGSSPQAWNNLLGYLNLFSQQAYNAELLTAGGQTQGEATATEINALSSRLGQILGFLEEKYYRWWDDVCVHAFWWMQRDPLLNEVITIEILGEELQVPLTAQVFQQLGDYVPKFRVKRGSMKRMDKTLRTQQTIQIVGTVIPIAANMMQMNPNFDGTAFITSMLKGVVDPAEIAKWWAGGGIAVGSQEPTAGEKKSSMMPMPGGSVTSSRPGGRPTSLGGVADQQPTTMMR